MNPDDANDTAVRVARESYGKLVALLAARDRDVAAAEDALAEAFAAALERWPKEGTPANPEGWLVTAARRKLADASRRRRSAATFEPELQRIAEELGEADFYPDRRLALMFACAHPSLDEAVRAPLMLQCVLGLTAAEIGSAFLISPAAMGQRLARAKAKIRAAGVPFRIPDPDLWPERIDTVLQAIYAAFGQGWQRPFDDESAGRALAEEAIWLCRVVVGSAPDDAEAMGLLALMRFAESRRKARRDAAGLYVPLDRQDVAAWDGEAILEAEALLRRAAALRRPGRFQLEAAIQSVHVARGSTGHTDWSALVELYDALQALTGSPVVAVNRAIAIAGRDGAEPGLQALKLAESGEVLDYQAYWAAKAELEARLGLPETDASYERAIGLAIDPAIRAFLTGRREAARGDRER